jgi:chromosome segregation ATPase
MNQETEALKVWLEKKFAEQEEKFDKKLDGKLGEKLEPIENRLKHVEERVEEVRVDTSTLNFKATSIKVSQDVVDKNMGIMKVDITDLKRDVKEMRKEGKGTFEIVKEILGIAVTREEHQKLEKRIAALEQL